VLVSARTRRSVVGLKRIEKHPFLHLQLIT
jgi:hypothetical protein